MGTVLGSGALGECSQLGVQQASNSSLFFIHTDPCRTGERTCALDFQCLRTWLGYTFASALKLGVAMQFALINDR